MTDKQKEKLRSQFLRLTKSKGFLSIEEIVSRLDGGDFWTDEFLETAVFEAKKSLARKFAREAKDKNGERIFHSIERVDSEGDTVRAYKQETLFDKEDYRQVIAYHVQQAHYHKGEAKRMQSACLQRLGVQIELTFDDGKQAQRAKPAKKVKSQKRVKPNAEV
jgi:hypothetical protein